MFRTIMTLFAAILMTASTAHAAAIHVYRQAKDVDAFWDFNGSNPLADKTGNGHALVNPGGGNSPNFTTSIAPSSNGWTPNEITATEIVGETSRAAAFDGNDRLDRLDLPGGLYGGGDFTFLIAGNTTSGAFETYLGGDTFRYQKTSSGAHTFRSNTSPGGTSAGSTIGINDWHLVAITYNSATDQVVGFNLTNGTTFPGNDFAGIHDLNGGGQTNFQIGFNGLSGIGGTDGFNGQLDFAIFHNQVLSGAELQGLVDDFLLGPTLVPEPATASLLGIGSLVVCASARRRRRRGAGRGVRKGTIQTC